MTRKIISLFLCATFAVGSLSLLASCAENNGSNNNGGGEVKTSPSSKVPIELNFRHLSEEERTINIAYNEGGNITLTEHSLVVDETNMDPTDQVDINVQKRNQTVESQLGVILKSIKTNDGLDGMADVVKDSIMNGDGTYDILAAYQYYAITMAANDNGLLLNLNDLTAVGEDAINADYIDLYAPYWGTAYNDAISYKGAYYWLTGDIALRYMGGMYCTFVNSKTYSERLESTYGNIYEIAKRGEWTMDLMMEMAALCHDDVNADDAKDEGDKFGFGYELQDCMEGIAYGAGVQFSWKDPATGDIMFTFNNQKTMDISTKLVKLLTASSSFEYAGNDSDAVMPAFASGNMAFTVNKIYMSQIYLNEFNDFYLIPSPKYDLNQTNYITGIHDGVTLFGIPKDCQKLPQTAATLELLAAYSTEFVKPAYYDAALKSRYVRDADAAEMIDLIHSCVNTDFVAAWGKSIDSISQCFRTTSKIDKAYLSRRNSKWNTSLQTLTASLEAAADNSVSSEDAA